VLLVSFGGPEGPDDVLPFLQNVTRGRAIPPERLDEVAEHYLLFGGVSPINAQNAALLAALRKELDDHQLDLPVYWGNRNWDPYLADAVAAMARDGVRRALAFVTAAYSSYSGCRQYRENLFDAADRVAHAPAIDKIRPYFDHPGFVGPVADATLEALGELPHTLRSGARLAFTTHSIPVAQADSSGALAGAGGAYVAQHRATAALVAEHVARETGVAYRWDLVFQSRSGAPSQLWLEPDVAVHLEQLAADAVPAVVVVPIGFVSDHIEVVYDLDTLARQTADLLGLPMVRAATPGTDPRFVAMIVDLVRERVEGSPAPRRDALSALGLWPDVCVAGCCPNPRAPRPALAGGD
jgi:ferrochelatase